LFPVFVIVSHIPIYPQRSLWADDVTVLRRRTMRLGRRSLWCRVARCTRNDVTVFRRRTWCHRDVISRAVSCTREDTEQNSHMTVTVTWP